MRMQPIHYTSLIVILLLLGSLAWVNNDEQAPFLVLILTLGATGAVVREHIERRGRLARGEADPAGRAVWFSPILGALLALILASLFLAGLIAGDLFPTFLHTDQAFESARDVLRGGVTLKSNSDFYKMLAWSLVAGYSERFVLSKLDAITTHHRIGPHQGSD